VQRGGSVFHFKNDLVKIRNLPDLLLLISRSLKKVGISHFLNFDRRFVSDICAAIGVYPDGLLNDIQRNEFHRYDLAVRHFIDEEAALPLFRSDIDDHVRSAGYRFSIFQRHMEFSGFLEKKNIFDVYYLPVTTDCYRSIFCCWSDNCDSHGLKKIVYENKEFIEYVAFFLNDLIREKSFSLRSGRGVKLRQRPIEIVQLMVQKDLRSHEIARLLGLHEVTVNKHVAFFKEIYGRETLHAAIADAYLEGMINLG